MSATPEAWEAALRARLGREVRVRFGRSRRLPMQLGFPPGGPSLRLHRMFAAAPEEVVDAVGAWLRSGPRARRAARLLDAWIDDRLRALPRRVVALRPRGRSHDLEALAAELFAGDLRLDFPPDRERPGVTWGRRGPSRCRRSLLLGSYDPHAAVARVHPVLDRASVPTWFVRYILFHELLHAVYPAERDPSGHWQTHGPAFRRRERAHPDFARALRWQREHLDELIRLATGRGKARTR